LSRKSFGILIGQRRGRVLAAHVVDKLDHGVDTQRDESARLTVLEAFVIGDEPGRRGGGQRRFVPAFGAIES